MTKPKIALLVVSCDKYSDVWPLFFDTFKKYWPDCPFEIYLGSNFLESNASNVKTIKVGEDLSYSENLLEMLKEIDAEYILMWVDDLMLSSKVKSRELQNIITAGIQRNVDFLKLLPNYPMSYENEDGSNIGILPNGIKYQFSIGISLIKKSFLQLMLAERRNAWELEYEISKKIKYMHYKLYALTDRKLHSLPFQFINVLGRGKVIRSAINFLKINNNTNLIKNRGLQSLSDYAYYRLYLLRLWFFRKLKIYWI